MPQSLFETDDDRTFFATTLYIHPDFIGVGKNDTINDTINSNDEAILKLMKDNPKITRKQLCEELGVSDSTILRSIDKLRRLKYITRVGSNKSGYWDILQKNNSNHCKLQKLLLEKHLNPTHYLPIVSIKFLK